MAFVHIAVPMLAWSGRAGQMMLQRIQERIHLNLFTAPHVRERTS